MEDLTEEQRDAVGELMHIKDPFWLDVEAIAAKDDGKSANVEQDVQDYADCVRSLSGCGLQKSADMDYVLKYAGGLEEATACVHSASQHLAEMKGVFADLLKHTSTLYDACNELTAEEANLISSTEQIYSRLAYFDACDRVEQKLSSPLLAVTSDSFMHIISTIDNGIVFFTAHSDIKDSSEYLNRYNKCLSKALDLVRTHVVKLLSAATHNVLARCKMDGGESDAFTQLYCVFASNAVQVRTIMKDFEPKKGINAHYAALVNDCYDFYFMQRELLVQPSFAKSIRELVADGQKSCCSLMRSSCSMLFRLCDDEYNLLDQFFVGARDAFDIFIRKLAHSFCDLIRPRIIRLEHLETLVDVSSLLRVHLLEQRCYVSDDSAYAGLAYVLEEILGDVTERLLYRTELYAKYDIGEYKPSPGDIAYPEKLSMIKDIIAFSGSGAVDVQGLWYPTVQRTVSCLSKLNVCLDATSFQGITSDVISMCIKSLTEAHELIEASKGPTNASLFLLKHLLILRAQVGPLVAEVFSEATVDFSKIKDSAVNLLQQKRQWFSLGGDNAFLQFLVKMPLQTTECVVIDSRRSLDVVVKAACQIFIGQSAKLFVGEMQALQTQMEDAKKGAAKVPKEQLVEPKVFSDTVLRMYRKLKKELPEFRTLMSLYFCNEDTENILYTPIKNEIRKTCESIRQLIRENYEEEDGKLIGLPSAEELALLLRG